MKLPTEPVERKEEGRPKEGGSPLLVYAVILLVIALIGIAL